MVKNLLKTQMISMCQWAVKFVTRFCATSSWMIYNKQWKMAECPCCGHPQETTAHILQCPNAGSQTMWDDSILQLQHTLLEANTNPSLIKDLSIGLDMWRHHTPTLMAITPAGVAQTVLTWDNFVHGFILTSWKHQQANYYKTTNNPSSIMTWAANLLCGILKVACKQWDHWNKVLHKLQPDRVKDQILDTEIQQQYNWGRTQMHALPKHN